MKYCFIIFFYFYSFLLFSQRNTPITASEIEQLKKEEKDFWYVDSPPPAKKNVRKTNTKTSKKSSRYNKNRRSNRNSSSGNSSEYNGSEQGNSESESDFNSSGNDGNYDDIQESNGGSSGNSSSSNNANEKNKRSNTSSNNSSSSDTKAQQNSTSVTKKVETQSSLSFFGVLEWILILALVIGFLFLIFKILSSRSSIPFKNKKVDISILETTPIETEDQLKNILYQDEITKAEAQGNYRLAIRLYYLRVLKKFIEAGLVRFHINKTNNDYCEEVKNHKIYADFRECTQFYNYVWFGEFGIDIEAYQMLKTDFNNLLEKPL
jgi:hypothetical protein